jgi:fluoroquinolone transport system permease protein
MGALVLLEKGERTLEAQSVTPLSPVEYLASKSISLGLLSLIENLILTFIVMGTAVNYAALTIGILLFSFHLSLYGFWVVIRYHNLNEYLFPSFLYTMPLSLPFVAYFGIWTHWTLYAFPSLPPLIFFQRAFTSASLGDMMYAGAYGTIWVGLFLLLAMRAYDRYVRSSSMPG